MDIHLGGGRLLGDPMFEFLACMSSRAVSCITQPIRWRVASRMRRHSRRELGCCACCPQVAASRWLRTCFQNTRTTCEARAAPVLARPRGRILPMAPAALLAHKQRLREWAWCSAWWGALARVVAQQPSCAVTRTWLSSPPLVRRATCGAACGATAADHGRGERRDECRHPHHGTRAAGAHDVFLGPESCFRVNTWHTSPRLVWCRLLSGFRNEHLPEPHRNDCFVVVNDRPNGPLMPWLQAR